MASLKFLTLLPILLAMQGCAERYRGLDLAPGTDDSLLGYVAQLEPLAKGRRTRSNLTIQPDGQEEWIDVTRISDHYQVSVTFCPEDRENQERQLLETLGSLPDDMIAGTSIGENRCSYGRWFRFALPKDTANFVRRALEVLGATSFQYSINSTTLR